MRAMNRISDTQIHERLLKLHEELLQLADSAWSPRAATALRVAARVVFRVASGLAYANLRESGGGTTKGRRAEYRTPGPGEK